jgi:hypothetical protein
VIELIRFQQNDRLGLPLISISDLNEPIQREDHASSPSGSWLLSWGFSCTRGTVTSPLTYWLNDQLSNDSLNICDNGWFIIRILGMRRTLRWQSIARRREYSQLLECRICKVCCAQAKRKHYEMHKFSKDLHATDMLDLRWSQWPQVRKILSRHSSFRLPCRYVLVTSST